MNWFLKAIQTWARKRSYRLAVKAANKEHAKTNRKVLVILWKGEFIALTKKRLKRLRNAGAIGNDFVKSCEQYAVYTAK